MAGGVKKPINVFRLGDLGEPKGVFNWRLWFSVLSFGLLGAARGIDEGLISGAFKSKHFQHLIHFDTYSKAEQTNVKANISSMVLMGSVAGSLFAFFVCDRIGRLWATRQLCVWWIVGMAMVLGNNGNIGLVYAGRFIAGFGIGQTPVVGPVYLAEIAPASVRGLCTCVFTGNVYLGINLAYWSNYGAERGLGSDVAARWMIPTSLHIMFASLIFFLSWFQFESPRFLVKKGKIDEATRVMSKIRRLPEDHPYVVNEISAIKFSHDCEVAATQGMTIWGMIKQTLSNKQNLFRLYLTTSVQFLSQWSGAGSITIYAVDLFEILGITGGETSLLVTAVFGLVKLFAAILCALFLVDVIGRKRSLLIGITLQTISMIYVAAFLTSQPKLGVDKSYHLPANKKSVSMGAIAMIYVSGFGWALGWNSMQYLLTSELFPLNIRAVATSWAMALHFLNQYANARAVPNLLEPLSRGGITPAGTFWSFACITIIGGAWVWFFVPETAGRSLEDMDKLFELPWYKIGRYGNAFADEQDEIERHAEDEKADKVLHLENAVSNTTSTAPHLAKV
ncbi:hypothetical protein VHUM_02047 [Vanrija humicola]|uniref:Major facilitator superfamily (MFS) profile domain-containing protein n=1 Tax=Vanrija humicola TaxID=5417 RepID=A0A7D8Z9E2_VANHU|nr:hypothetical protein VHUM_02047 [Vanrija humicola]